MSFASNSMSTTKRCEIRSSGMSTVRNVALCPAGTYIMSDPVITPELFAQTVVEDYALAPSYHAVIVKSIQEQLSDFRSHTVTYGTVEDSNSDDDGAQSAVVMRGELGTEDAQWWEIWRRRVKAIGSSRKDAEDQANPPARSASRGKKQKVKKEEDDGELAMLADNEDDNEEDGEEDEGRE